MISENNFETNTNNENPDYDLYQQDIEINIDYELWYRKEPKIKGLIIDLRNKIDKIVEQKEIIKERILELAKNLKESNLCDADKISITIKSILKEEIKYKKISARWIEKILSDQYKRKYKKANKTLSTKNKQTPLLVTNISGKSFAVMQEENTFPDSDKREDQFYNHNYRKEPTDFKFPDIDIIGENKELKEALEKTTTFQTANNLIKEIQFPKEKSNEFQTALNECNAFVFIRFNAKGIVESIEPDTIRKHGFENVNDISNDDYTY